MQLLMNQDDVREAPRRTCAAIGSQNAWARQHKIAQQNVSEVIRGMRPPSDRVLAAVGLRKVAPALRASDRGTGNPRPRRSQLRRLRKMEGRHRVTRPITTCLGEGDQR